MAMDSLFDSPAFNERLFFPRPDRSRPPPRATDLHVPVAGATLHVRWHRSLPDGATLLLFHGNGEVVSDYDRLAGHFAASGVNLAVMDYRGYGSSTGTPTIRGLLADSMPVLAALQRAGAAPLFVMGRSLGSACAAELYQSEREGVVGYIWESGIADLHAMLRRRGLTPPAQFPASDLAAFDPRGKVSRGNLPLLVMHGACDTLISPAEAQEIFDAAGARRKEITYIPEAGHNDLMAAPLYWQTLKRFVGTLSR